MRITILAALFTFLTACGGGGGGSNNSTPTTPTAPLLTFDPLTGTSTANPVMDIFKQDLDGDTIDEIIIVGRMSQPATDANWEDFNMQIFVWENGELVNKTSTWFPAGINVITGSEPSVQFGDFNNDGYTDMFVAASTDMYDSNPANGKTLRGDNLMFLNDGVGAFSLVTLDTSARWSHDSVAHDFTGDGILDVMVTDYQGNAAIFTYHNSTWETLTPTTPFYASGITVGDFIPGGQKEVVTTDDAAYGNQTVMYSYSVNLGSGTFTLTYDSTLPAEHASYQHSIRALAVDYDGDTVEDLVVFARDMDPSGGSYVQVLTNDGFGNFTDDTATKLTGYVGNAGGVNYQPELIDIDGDSDLDIFLSGVDYDGAYDASQVLVLGSAEYTSAYNTELGAHWLNRYNATPNANPSGQTQKIVMGPNNTYYLITTVLIEQGGDYKAALHATELGFTPNANL